MTKGKHLGELEQLVLLAILQLGDDAYGTAVMGELQQRGGRSVSRGVLYVTLDRMEAKGLLSSRTGETSPRRGGKPRRYLSVTPEGRRSLQESRDTLARMWEGLLRIG